MNVTPQLIVSLLAVISTILGMIGFGMGFLAELVVGHFFFNLLPPKRCLGEISTLCSDNYIYVLFTSTFSFFMHEWSLRFLRRMIFELFLLSPSCHVSFVTLGESIVCGKDSFVLNLVMHWLDFLKFYPIILELQHE